MKYTDVIQFDPIKTIIQLHSAEQPDTGQGLVASYVISSAMRNRLIDVVIPQLRLHPPADQKGILIVGNYGTGKSHLLAMLSTIAEREDVASSVRDATVGQQLAEAVAGQFKVIRIEIGATEMRLRNIIVGEIEDALARWGVTYQFPSMGEASNTKDALTEMMVAFQERFPKQGLLLVLDELLDYLRTRDGQALVLDLGFLREVGEVCATTRLRFIGGLQESLFDSSSFQFVASALQRVRARFEQVRIAREDISFVVTERLLRKDDRQRGLVREHLQRFVVLYPQMAERLEQYVSLFPIHPSYIDIFEQLHIVEKRDILKTLSRAMEVRIGEDVPDDRPGLITFDSYWKTLREDRGWRTFPEVGEVIDKSNTLQAKVDSGYTRSSTKSLALQIIDALSLHRLTTEELRAPIGLTPIELRDDLCLYTPIPSPDADFLASTIKSALNEISKTVNGQYLSSNPDNGQWYLDVQKDIDHDALIVQRAGLLSPDDLDRAYYDVLAQVMDVANVQEYRLGFKIWEYDLEWRERKVTRPGYLFFGIPGERSTTQPPREFYLYFPQPFGVPADDGASKGQPDEVFFRLTKREPAFEAPLRLYAAAMAMADSVSNESKKIYRDKASSTNAQRSGYLQQVVTWLQNNLLSAFEVDYEDRARPFKELLQGKASSIKEMVDQVAASCLAPYFAAVLPGYPTFTTLVTRENRAKAAAEAIRWIVGPLKLQTGAAVLGALELLDGDRLTVDSSPYARAVRDLLVAQGNGKVLNRADLIESSHNGLIERERRFGLEPEWLAVVLLALVHAGEIVITLPGERLDAGTLERAAKLSLDELLKFKSIQRPQELPIPALTALFELLGLAPGLIKDPSKHGDAVAGLNKQANEEIGQVLALQQRVSDGFPCWGASVVEGTERDDTRKQLAGYRDFLDGLTTLNTPGKLKNFRTSEEEVRGYNSARALVRTLKELSTLIGDLTPLANYLLLARATLAPADPLAVRIADTETRQVLALRDPQARAAPGARESLLGETRELKAEYIKDYELRHRRARLTLDQYKRKQRVASSPAMQRLRALRAIAILPGNQLDSIDRELQELVPCGEFSSLTLDTVPICPHCQFQPSANTTVVAAATALGLVEEHLEGLEQEWASTLQQNLADPTVQVSLGLLSPAERQPLTDMLASGRLPDSIDKTFLQALHAAFTDLEQVLIIKETLINRLTAGGSPSTADEFKERFAAYLKEVLQGHEEALVRIVVE